MIIIERGIKLEKQNFIPKTYTLTPDIIELIEEIQFKNRISNTSKVVREALLIGLEKMKGERKNV